MAYAICIPNKPDHKETHTHTHTIRLCANDVQPMEKKGTTKNVFRNCVRAIYKDNIKSYNRRSSDRLSYNAAVPVVHKMYALFVRYTRL